MNVTIIKIFIYQLYIINAYKLDFQYCLMQLSNMHTLHCSY